MQGLKKSKRVSWASDVDLCQVRLFLSEECPSQVGLGGQDHLQAKTSWSLLPTGMNSDNNLPPGFEGIPPVNLLKNRLSQIPIVKWRPPTKLVLDLTWQVVAGEESQEVEAQNQREMRVLEAVYPRPSAIPSNPPSLTVMEDSIHNDQSCLLIPISPVEDEDAAEDASLETMTPETFPASSHHHISAPGTPASQSRESTERDTYINRMPGTGLGMIHGVQPDAVAATYTAMTAVITDNVQENLIDRDLLVKILSDPILVENLITCHGTASSPQLVSKLRSPRVPSSDLPPAHVNKMAVVVAPSLASTPSVPFYPAPNSVRPVPNLQPPLPDGASAPLPPAGVHGTKDINYYKSLIQQHGEERHILPQFSSRHNQEVISSLKPWDLKPKIMKPCIYFNSSRGCRHGANCAYQHDTSPQHRISRMPELQSPKRMKPDREITGT